MTRNPGMDPRMMSLWPAEDEVEEEEEDDDVDDDDHANDGEWLLLCGCVVPVCLL